MARYQLAVAILKEGLRISLLVSEGRRSKEIEPLEVVRRYEKGEGKGKAVFKLSIVTEAHAGEVAGIDWGKDARRGFQVVVKNISDRPQKVFKTSNSWGYWAVSFEFALESGEKVVVTPNSGVSFTRNVPGTLTIPPGGSHGLPDHVQRLGGEA